MECLLSEEGGGCLSKKQIPSLRCGMTTKGANAKKEQRREAGAKRKKGATEAAPFFGTAIA
jgi:hypothetical protein